MMRVADDGGGCRMQMQVAYKYGSFVYLSKVQKTVWLLLLNG